ncbi:hypothetical protein PoB_004236200 [Plakobranchus ocellatus]|uniref:Uncharacterized protein n=1 Tax=Plakobranchus ocellatus TaxID=259542 RepID=A0AAV4B9Q6_9GAST|nr:hypothetical protein PoB_004236200 [Plakobranchus ocellatus]
MGVKPSMEWFSQISGRVPLSTVPPSPVFTVGQSEGPLCFAQQVDRAWIVTELGVGGTVDSKSALGFEERVCRVFEPGLMEGLKA